MDSWFNPPSNIDFKELSAREFIIQFLGVENTIRYQEFSPLRSRYFPMNTAYFSITVIPNQVIEVSGYDYFKSFSIYGNNFATRIMTSQGDLEIRLNPNEGTLAINWKGRLIPIVQITQSWMASLREEYGELYNLPEKVLTFTGQDGDIYFKITLQNILGTLQENHKSLTVTKVKGDILFTISKSRN